MTTCQLNVSNRGNTMKTFEVTKVTRILERVSIDADDWETAEDLSLNAQNWEIIDYRETIEAEEGEI
jgi:hypothetical protein